MTDESNRQWGGVEPDDTGRDRAASASNLRWSSEAETSMLDLVEEPAPVPLRTKKAGRGAAELLRTVLIAAIVFVGARVFVLPYEVEGASMFPNLHNSERVLVNRSVYWHVDVSQFVNWIPGVDLSQKEIYPFHPPERGDIVVLNPPVPNATEPYIKRIIATAGETVSFKNGYVYIDGKRLDEPYIKGAITSCDRIVKCEFGTVPDGYVYVLGDNRQNSSDSRSFGFVKIDDIIGKAWFANWPLDRIGILPHYNYDE
jgi:signal peptidase I